MEAARNQLQVRLNAEKDKTARMDAELAEANRLMGAEKDKTARMDAEIEKSKEKHDAQLKAKDDAHASALLAAKEVDI